MGQMTTKYHCKNCGHDHDLHYSVFNDGTRHMFYICPVNRSRHYVPRVDGLDLQIEPTNAQKKAQKLAEKARQQPTFQFAPGVIRISPHRPEQQHKA